MSKKWMRWVWIAVAAMVLLVIIWWFMPGESGNSSHPQRDAMDTLQMPPASTATQQAQTPLIAPQRDAQRPDLNRSDVFARSLIRGVIGDDVSDARFEQLIDPLLGVDDVIRRTVAFSAGLSRGVLNWQALPRPFAGQFLARRDRFSNEERIWIDEAGYDRYTPFIELLETIDEEQLVQAVLRAAPLIDAAVLELGERDRRTADFLVGALDQITDAKIVEGSVRLVQPSVVYRFAEERWEQSSALQKLMIRMGPNNATRLKNVAGSWRWALTTYKPLHR